MAGLDETGVILTTSIATFVTGFLVGVWAIRGYIISPELTAERRANTDDPVESDESDIDESDTILDHAPSWGNGPQADRRQGLSVKASQQPALKSNEECKLVLVVRTDLGMTKGESGFSYALRIISASLASTRLLTRNTIMEIRIQLT